MDARSKEVLIVQAADRCPLQEIFHLIYFTTFIYFILHNAVSRYMLWKDDEDCTKNGTCGTGQLFNIVEPVLSLSVYAYLSSPSWG
jgi:hypothetical protein